MYPLVFILQSLSSFVIDSIYYLCACWSWSRPPHRLRLSYDIIVGSSFSITISWFLYKLFCTVFYDNGMFTFTAWHSVLGAFCRNYLWSSGTLTARLLSAAHSWYVILIILSETALSLSQIYKHRLVIFCRRNEHERARGGIVGTRTLWWTQLPICLETLARHGCFVTLKYWEARSLEVMAWLFLIINVECHRLLSIRWPFIIVHHCHLGTLWQIPTMFLFCSCQGGNFT
jgi:hypothetical protein